MECEPNQSPASPSAAAAAPAFDPAAVVLYKRNRFQSRLPKDRLYARSHFWLQELEPANGATPALYRVGFTRFATRMLGDIVEHGFEAKPGQTIGVGQTIGWVEGFKALSDVYGVIDGVFEAGNPQLATLTLPALTKTPTTPAGFTRPEAFPNPTAWTVERVYVFAGCDDR